MSLKSISLARIGMLFLATVALALSVGVMSILYHSTQTRFRFQQYVRVNVQGIMRAARELTAEVPEEGGIVYGFEPNELPPVLKEMNPTYVVTYPTYVRIELAGGFEHRGLYVVCDNSAGDPFAGDGMVELAPGLWYYEGE